MVHIEDSASATHTHSGGRGQVTLRGVTLRARHGSATSQSLELLPLTRPADKKRHGGSLVWWVTWAVYLVVITNHMATLCACGMSCCTLLCTAVYCCTLWARGNALLCIRRLLFNASPKVVHQRTRGENKG